MWQLYVLIGIILVYFLILFWLRKRGAFKGERFSLLGPFLMLKTSRGRRFIDKLAKIKRFWRYFGTFAIVICIVSMIGITVMLVWSAFLVPSIAPEEAPTPEMLLGIPGLNPLIPIWYGLIALILAVVIHEFSHGILMRVANMKIRSLGVLFFVIPLGAFVEPDEEELKKSEKKKRMRMFAAGAAMNIVIALICAAIFSMVFMGSVSSVHDGAGITHVEAGAPASTNLTEGMIITNIRFDREGALIIAVVDDSPASGNLTRGMILTSVNGTALTNDDDFSQAMTLTHANQTVNISVYYLNDIQNYTITLADRYDFTEEMDDKGKGYLGVATIDTDIGITSPQDFSIIMSGTYSDETIYITVYRSNNYENYTVVLADRSDFTGKAKDEGKGYLGVIAISTDTAIYHPISSADQYGGIFNSAIYYISMPLIGLSPLQYPITEFYEISGPLAALPSSVFWPMANIFYWLFWINLMLGVTNTLPAVPLDGGYLFKDSLDAIIKKLRKGMSPEAREKVVSTISIALALFILFLIIWVFIGPYVPGL